MSADLDPVTAARLWNGVATRRAQRARWRRRLALFEAFAAGVAGTALFIAVLVHEHRQPPPVELARDTGSLKVRGGPIWTTVEPPSVTEVRIMELDDGSRVELDPGARLAPIENTDRSMVLLLEGGRALFDIQPGGPRRWSIEAGLATIEVVGTRFEVVRTEARVVVAVERGTVLVRGERVRGRLQRLAAGDRLEIVDAPAPAPVSSTPPRKARQPEAPKEEPKEPIEPQVEQESAWRDLARQGDYDKAYRALGPDGIAARAQTADVDRLLALADVARLSGHPADAIEPLRRVVAAHGSDPRAAMAAFTLGRVDLDSLGDPASAARDFAEAIAMGPPQALLEDAHLRLIEARAKAGDRDGAHRAWEAYVHRFPDSPRRSIADQWGAKP